MYRKYKWLDLRALGMNLIQDNEELRQVLYFTAYCTWDKFKRERHRLYVQALTKHGVQTVLGKYQEVTKKFKKHSMRITNTAPYSYDERIIPDEIEYITYEEKRTDVNIGISILDYAQRNAFDHAYILTADGDIAPAIELAKRRFPEKKFTSVLPIQSSGSYMQKVCDDTITLRESDLQKAQLPNKIVIDENVTVERPISWH